MKKIQLNLILFFVVIFNFNLYGQEWSSSDLGYLGHNIDFISADIGFIGVSLTSPNRYEIKKTTDKGQNFSTIWTSNYNQWNTRSFSFDMINENVGYVYTEGTIFKTSDGGANWVQKYLIDLSYYESNYPTIKFANENLGFVSFTSYPHSDTTKMRFYKIYNNGNSIAKVFSSATAHKYVPFVKDIAISPNLNRIIAVGFYNNYDNIGEQRKFVIESTDGGNNFSVLYNTELEETQFGCASFFPGNSDAIRLLGGEDYGVSSNTGTYCYTAYSGGTKYKITDFTEYFGGITFVNSEKGFASINNKIYQTTNSGVNWTLINTYPQESDSYVKNSLAAYNDIVYGVDKIGNFFRKNIYTNLVTLVDNQSITGSFFFNGTEYTTPHSQYFGGGNSSVYSTIEKLNSGQSNEGLFYRWSDNYPNHTNHTTYFDATNSTISTQYKTRQISTTSEAIKNTGQIKVIKDNWGAINQIHQSLNGGIFYTKSYNNGSSYNREEIISKFSQEPFSGNKNPSLSETRWYNVPSSYPVNKNVVASWERIKQDSTEIRVAVRDWNITSDTVFQWNCWYNSGSDIFTKFASSSNYNSNPQIFALSTNLSSLGTASEYFFVVPHLRPYSGGNKLWVSCKKGSALSADFALDSGDISDFSVIDSAKIGDGNYVRLHFAYRKGANIIYRKTGFEQYSTLPLAKYDLEGPTVVSSGDGGFSSRLTPTISLMDNVPVIAYSANYNAWRTIQFEDNSTSTINVYRYPIVKVQRYGANNWGNYVIYNSGNIQSRPEIEGNRDTLSYILNYAQGEGIFKKVANIVGLGGFNVIPNTFTGTDARLIKNSFSGGLGSNMSMLTLSPQSSVYKLDKQDFVISNITAQFRFHFDGLLIIS